MKNDIKLLLATMYEYICDIFNICNEDNNNYDKILSNKKNQLAITMCLVQIGELSNKIKEKDIDLYTKYRFNEPKGMRDRIVHGYGKIDFNIIKETIVNDLPRLKHFIENNVENNYLKNPYLLYDL